MSGYEFNKEAEELRHQHLYNTLDRIELKADKIDQKVDYTNGKVKRLTLGLSAVASFVAGLGLVEIRTILTFFL